MDSGSSFFFNIYWRLKMRRREEVRRGGLWRQSVLGGIHSCICSLYPMVTICRTQLGTWARENRVTHSRRAQIHTDAHRRTQTNPRTHTHCRPAGAPCKCTYTPSGASPPYLDTGGTVSNFILGWQEHGRLISAGSPTGRGNTPLSPWDRPDRER